MACLWKRKPCSPAWAVPAPPTPQQLGQVWKVGQSAGGSAPCSSAGTPLTVGSVWRGGRGQAGGWRAEGEGLHSRGHLFRAAAGRAVSATECNACHHSVLLRLCISSSASGVGAWGRGFSGTRAECSVRVPAAWQAADVAQGVSPCLRAGRPRRCSLLLAHTDLALTAGEFGMELGLLGWGVGLSHGAGRGSGPGTRGGTLLSRGLRRRSC